MMKVGRVGGMGGGGVWVGVGPLFLNNILVQFANDESGAGGVGGGGGSFVSRFLWTS